MADYYLKRDMLDEAQEFAMKCTQLNDVLEVSRIKTSSFFLFRSKISYFLFVNFFPFITSTRLKWKQILSET